MTTLTAEQLARVRFYARPDGWAAWEAAIDDGTARDELLSLAFLELADARLVAAYVLGVACAQLRARSDADSSAQVKRLRDGGEEIEFFEPMIAAHELADDLSRRAAELRRIAAALQVPKSTVLPVFAS